MTTPTLLAEIKAARDSQGLTQAELASRAGVPLRTYLRLESGDRGTKLETVLRTLDALGLVLKTGSKRRPSLEELSELYGDG